MPPATTRVARPTCDERPPDQHDVLASSDQPGAGPGAHPALDYLASGGLGSVSRRFPGPPDRPRWRWRRWRCPWWWRRSWGRWRCSWKRWRCPWGWRLRWRSQRLSKHRRGRRPQPRHQPSHRGMEPVGARHCAKSWLKSTSLKAIRRHQRRGPHPQHPRRGQPHPRRARWRHTHPGQPERYRPHAGQPGRYRPHPRKHRPLQPGQPHRSEQRRSLPRR